MTCPRRRHCRTRTASCRSSRSCGCWPGCAGRSAPSRCPASRRCACRRRGRRAGSGRRSGCGRSRAGRGGTAAGTGCGCWPRTAPSATSPTPGAATQGRRRAVRNPRTSPRPAPARPLTRRSGWSRPSMSGPAARWPGRPGHAAPGRPPSPRTWNPPTGPVTWTWPTAGSPAARRSPPRSMPGSTPPGGCRRRGRCAARDGPCRTAPGRRRSPGTAARTRSASSNTTSTRSSISRRITCC